MKKDLIETSRTEERAGLAASVIVPVRNGRRDLEGLLEALARQTFPRERFEVVIGDDGSTDGAPDSLATEDGWIKVVSGPPRNSYAARNRAVAAASAPVLAFCDADCRPEPNWLAAGLAALDGGDLVGGHIRLIVPEPRSVWTLVDLDYSKDQARGVLAGKAETANLFVRRPLFDDLGGFDESLASGGDYEFVARCISSGARLRYAGEAVVRHPTRDRAQDFLRTIVRIHRAQAVRATREGRPPRFLTNKFYIPVLGMFLTRRSVNRSPLLDLGRLEQNGVQPTALEQLRALPVMYLVLPYVAGAATFLGWLDGRRALAGSPEGTAPSSGSVALAERERTGSAPRRK